MPDCQAAIFQTPEGITVFYYLELTDCEFLNCLKNDLFHEIIREKVYDLVNCTYINTSISMRTKLSMR